MLLLSTPYLLCGLVFLLLFLFVAVKRLGPFDFEIKLWRLIVQVKATYTVVVVAPPPPTLQIANTPIEGEAPNPPVVDGSVFSDHIPVTGGTPPYKFAVDSGSLPPGVSLDPVTGQLSGTIPAGASSDGSYTFEVVVSDSSAQ